MIGKNGISAKIICDSISSTTGARLTTMEIEYPRFILAEVNTHRMLSKNSASSRAIPIKSINDMVATKPAKPIHWGANQAGMQANNEVNDKEMAEIVWNASASRAIQSSDALQQVGLHKQIVNRVTEPFQMMKTIVSGTEWQNLFWLRDHDDAQPEFHELAKCIHYEYEAGRHTAKVLVPGAWHLPYVHTNLNGDGTLRYYADIERKEEIDLETAQKISASCCAQVSYRKLDDSLDKAITLYERLVGSDRKHSSAFEHCGTPIDLKQHVRPQLWQDGVTHSDRDGNLWSGNFKGWIQYRQLIPGHVKW